jgi:hypothetical protein
MAKKENVRLYRAEEKSTGKRIVTDWEKQAPEYQWSKQAHGRWFVDDLRELKWYIEHEYPNGKIVFVDVPIEVAEHYRVSSLKKEGGKMIAENPFAFSNRPEKEYFLPREITDQKRDYIEKDSGKKEKGLITKVSIFILFIISGFVIILNSLNVTGLTISNLSPIAPKLSGLLFFFVGIIGLFLTLKK